MLAHATDEAIAGGTVSAETNATLVSVTEFEDTSTASGVGGGMMIAGGLLATAGSSGTMAATLGTSSKQARIAVAFHPAGPASLTAPSPVSLTLAAAAAALSVALGATQAEATLTGGSPDLTYVRYLDVPDAATLTLTSATASISLALAATSSALTLDSTAPDLTNAMLLTVPSQAELTLATYAASLSATYAVPSAATLTLTAAAGSLAIGLAATSEALALEALTPTLTIVTNYVTADQVDDIINNAVQAAIAALPKSGKVNAIPLGIKDEAAARSVRILEKAINNLSIVGGATGPAGPAGATGPAGVQGEAGPAGADGNDGADGTSTAQTFAITWNDGSPFTVHDDVVLSGAVPGSEWCAFITQSGAGGATLGGITGGTDGQLLSVVIGPDSTSAFVGKVVTSSAAANRFQMIQSGPAGRYTRWVYRGSLSRWYQIPSQT